MRNIDAKLAHPGSLGTYPLLLIVPQVYRCPRRYLFDEVTRRCQRERRVSCSKFDLQEADGYSGKEAAQGYDDGDVLVVIEKFIDDFFSTPLTYEETRWIFVRKHVGLNTKFFFISFYFRRRFGYAK